MRAKCFPKFYIHKAINIRKIGGAGTKLKRQASLPDTLINFHNPRFLTKSLTYLPLHCHNLTNNLPPPLAPALAVLLLDDARNISSDSSRKPRVIFIVRSSYGAQARCGRIEALPMRILRVQRSRETRLHLIRERSMGSSRLSQDRSAVCGRGHVDYYKFSRKYI